MKHIKRIRQMAPHHRPFNYGAGCIESYGTKKIKNKLVGHSIERIPPPRPNRTL